MWRQQSSWHVSVPVTEVHMNDTSFIKRIRSLRPDAQHEWTVSICNLVQKQYLRSLPLPFFLQCTCICIENHWCRITSVAEDLFPRTALDIMTQCHYRLWLWWWWLTMHPIRIVDSSTNIKTHGGRDLFTGVDFVSRMQHQRQLDRLFQIQFKSMKS